MSIAVVVARRPIPRSATEYRCVVPAGPASLRVVLLNGDGSVSGTCSFPTIWTSYTKLAAEINDRLPPLVQNDLGPLYVFTRVLPHLN